MMELIQALVAQLAQDGSWQCHLTEDERQAALGWARQYLDIATKQRYVQALARLRTLNEFMGSRGNAVGREVALQTWLG